MKEILKQNCWMKSKRRIIEKADELKEEMEQAMETYFENSEDRSTLEQWRKDVSRKILRYKRNQ